GYMADLFARVRAALAGRYTIERGLGRGGMATVYLARDLKHDRPVALKVLRPELAAVLGAERFLREIRLTAQLQHPHILTLIDSGDAGGFLYYVMPFVEGESLRQRLEREASYRSMRRCASPGRSPRPSTSPTDAASFIATSSPKTSCCTRASPWW